MTVEWVDKNGKYISPNLHSQIKIKLLNAPMEKNTSTKDSQKYYKSLMKIEAEVWSQIKSTRLTHCDMFKKD